MENNFTLKFYKSHYRRVADYILYNRGTEEEAEDAYHEAWKATLLRYRAGFEIDDFGKYLFTTAINFYRRECKRKGKELPTDPTDFERDTSDENDGIEVDEKPLMELPAEPAPDECPEPEGTGASDTPEADENLLLDLDNWGIVGRALLLLSKLHQEILYFALALGYNNAAIARQLGGYTENAMAVEKHRAYTLLRRHTAQLKHEEGDSYYKKIEERKNKKRGRGRS